MLNEHYQVFNTEFMQQMVLRQNRSTEIFKKSLLFLKNFNDYLLRLMVINLEPRPVVLFCSWWIFITQHAVVMLLCLKHCIQCIYIRRKHPGAACPAIGQGCPLSSLPTFHALLILDLSEEYFNCHTIKCKQSSGQNA